MICLRCNHYTHPDSEMDRVQRSENCRCRCHPWNGPDAPAETQLPLPLSYPPRPNCQYVLLMRVANQEIRVVTIPAGFKPKATRAFTWAGPFASEADARAALKRWDESVRGQLYPNRKNPR